jgi:hypothetical protein
MKSLWSLLLKRRMGRRSRRSRLCWAGVLGIRWIDPIAEASEFPDHFGSVPLLRLFGDGRPSFFVTDSLVQDQPDQPTLSMGNRPNDLVASTTTARS